MVGWSWYIQVIVVGTAIARDLRSMERAQLIDQLEHHAAVFGVLFEWPINEMTTWKPAPGRWSAVEIVCHLYDEEREDFRARLAHVLSTPGSPMPKIDPAAWVIERKYREQDYPTRCSGFISERRRSVEWLRGLTDEPWSNAYMHPTVGPVSCDLLLTNWVAHDLHHMRQWINLRYAHLASNSSVPLDYAGTW